MTTRTHSRNGFFQFCRGALARKSERGARPLMGPILERLEDRIAPAGVLTVTLSDNATSAQPGDTLHYIETINNTGDASALNLQLTHLLDSHTTLVPGSLNISPLAGDDSYTLVGNTPLIVNGTGTNPTSSPAAVLAGNLFANDLEFANDLGQMDTFTLAKVGASTYGGSPLIVATTHGSVTVNGDGTFTYTPAAGYIGTDSFTYTIKDTGSDHTAGTSDDLTSVGTVSLTVSNRVWYVDSSYAGANGTADGTALKPFTSLAPLNSSSPHVDGAGDYIYVHKGSGAYAGGLTLEGTQKLIGAGQNLAVGGFTLASGVTTDVPTITNSTGVALTLASGNTVNGVHITNSAGGGIAGVSVGTLTITNTDISVTGGAAVSIDGGALTVTLDSVSSSGSSGKGIYLNNVSNQFSVTNATSITNAAHTAIDLAGNSSANVSFGSLTISGVANNDPGVSLTGHTGSFTASGGALSGITGTDVSIVGGTGAISFAPNITNTAGRSIVIDNHDAGNITFSGSINDTGTGLLVQNSNGGTIAFTNATKIFNTSAGTGNAVTLTANGGAAIDFSGGGLVITSNAGSGFSATGLGTTGSGGTITVTGNGNTIDSSSGIALNVVDTNIGAAGLNFVRISAGNNTASADPASGLILNNTGVAGGLTITGTGTVDSGGVIQHTTSHGVVLINTKNVVFNRMSIHDTGDHGISGNNVSGFVFRDSSVFNFGDTASAGGATEDGINFTNLTGAVTIQRSTFGADGHFVLTPNPPGPENDGIVIRNTSVAPLTMTVTGSTFKQISNDGIDAEFTASGGSSISVDGTTADGPNIFNQLNGRAITFSSPVDNASNGTLDLTVKSNTFTSVGIGARWAASGGTTLNARFRDNTMTGTTNDAIRSIADASDPSYGPTTTVNATVAHNTMGGGSVFVVAHRGARENVSFGSTFAGQGNTGIGGTGIFVQADRAARVDIDLLNNSVTSNAADPNAPTALYLQSTNNGGGNSTISAKIAGNSFTAGPSGVAAIAIDDPEASNTIAIEGWNGSNGNTGAQSYLAANNTLVGSPTVDFATNVEAGLGRANVTPLALFFSPQPTVNDVAVSEPANPSAPDTQSDPASPGAVTTSGPAGADLGTLTQAQLDLLVSAAKARWIATGLTSEQVALLDSVQFGVARYDGMQLGAAYGDHISIDDDAAGNGWYVDSTPLDDTEFAAGAGSRVTALSGNAAGHVDALTTVMHELGHVLGLEDSYVGSDRDNLMFGFIGLGERRLPAAHQADGVTPHLQDGVDFAFASYTIGTLPVGKGITATYDAKIVSAPIPAGVDTITAGLQVTATGLSLISRTDSTTLVAQPDLQISSFGDGVGTAAPGDRLSFAISYKNTGTQDATGVFLTETLPAGTTLNTGLSTAGWTLVSGSTYRLDVGALAADGVAHSAAFVVDVTDPAPAGVANLASTAAIDDDHANGTDPNIANNSASDSDVLNAQHDLTLTNSDGGASVQPSGFVVYTLNYANAGNQNTTGVVITETVPAHSTFDSAHSTTGWVQMDATHYSFTVGNLAGHANGSVAFAVTADANPGGATQLSNSATITDSGINGADPTVGNNTASDSTPILSVDLSVSHSDAVTTVVPGGQYTYTFTYRNTGISAGNGTIISETLPNGVNFDPTDASGWVQDSVNPQLYRLDVGTVAAGDGDHIATMKVRLGKTFVAGVSTLSSTAAIAASPASGPDSDPSNNSSTDVNALDAAPDLMIVTSDGENPGVPPGSSIIYSLTYRNVGNQDATGVVVTETLPAGTTFNSAGSTSGWSTSDGVHYTFAVGNLGVRESPAALTFSVTSSNPFPGAQVSNTATIDDNHANGVDPNAANNSSTDTTPILGVDLALAVSDGVGVATPGGTLAYTLTYQNLGVTNSTGVVLTEHLPAGTTFNAGASSAGWTETAAGSGIYTLSVGPVAAGADAASKVFAVTVVNPAAAAVSTITNTASIDDDHANGPDSVAANNTGSDTDTLDAAPDLAITSNTDGVTVAAPGDTLTYTIGYSNHGNQNATGVVITDTLPAGTHFVAAENTGWTLTGSTLTYAVGNVAAGASSSVALKLHVDNAAAGQTQITHTASIADDAGNGADPTADNSATDTDTLNAAPDLAITVSNGVNVLAPGQQTTWTLAYSNDGNQGATGIVLTETLPAGVAFDPTHSTAGWATKDGVHYTLVVPEELAAGASGSAEFAVTINSPAAAGLHNISNTADVADDGANGADLSANNTFTDVDPLNAAPSFSFVVTDSITASVAHGGIVSYTITFSNVGNQDATGVFIQENLPAHSTFVASQSDADWVLQGDGSYRLSVGSLAAGDAPQSVVFSVRVDSDLPHGVSQVANTVAIDDDGTNAEGDLNVTTTRNTPIYQGIYVVAPGISLPKKGAPANVRVFDALSGLETIHFQAYESTYRDSVRIAVGDLNGDGFDDIITATRTGTGRVRVFDGVTGAQFSGPLGELNPFNGRSEKGAFVAAGDVTGDGHDDIVVSSAIGGGTVKVYDGLTGDLVSSYQPFGKAFHGGIRVAVGDINGDGTEDVITSQDTAGNRVHVYAGASTELLHNFEVGKKSYRGGLSVAVGDVNGDGVQDIITGRNANSAPLVETFSGIDHHQLGSFLAFSKSSRSGVRVGAVDINIDGVADIIVGAGYKGQSQVRILDGTTGDELRSFTAFSSYPDVSLFVAGSATIPSVLLPRTQPV